jgi:hypothetical protein
VQRQALAGVADAAAAAGASGIDLGHLRDAGEHRLDPDLARRRAADIVATQAAVVAIDDVVIDVTPDRIVVRVTGHVDYSLLQLLLGPGRLPVAVQAGAAPVRAP